MLGLAAEGVAGDNEFWFAAAVTALGLLLLLLLLLRGLLGVVALVLLGTRRLILLLMLLRGWCAASAHGLWLEPLLLLLLLLLLLGTQYSSVKDVTQSRLISYSLLKKALKNRTMLPAPMFMQQQPVRDMHNPNPHFSPLFQSRPFQQQQQSSQAITPPPLQPSFEPQAQLPSHSCVQLLADFIMPQFAQLMETSKSRVTGEVRETLLGIQANMAR
jgi:hypothetical protein